MASPRVPRPNATEDENDLLKLQEQFLKKSPTQELSVACVERIGDKDQVSPTSQPQSHLPETGSPEQTSPVKREREIPKTSTATSSSKSIQKRVKFGSDVEIPTPMDTDPAEDASPIVTDCEGQLPVVLGIVERDTSSIQARPPQSIVDLSFIKACRREKQLKAVGGLSLFAQQMQNARAKKAAAECPGTSGDIREQSNPPRLNLRAAVFEGGSVVLDGGGLCDHHVRAALVKEIHDENVAKLSLMSEEEILKEQQRLLESLDQNLVAFLKQKRLKAANSMTLEDKAVGIEEAGVCQPNDSQLLSPEVTPPNSKMMLPSASDSLTTTVVDEKGAANYNGFPIHQVEAKKWLNMDKVEKDKLAWITDLPTATSENTKTGQPARFDFEGTLISSSADVPTHLGLHHHGENPEVAGYTLEELFIYIRSSVQQQRVLALSTLANILKTNNEGRYDECLTEPLLPQLLDAGLVILLRWALDDNSENNVSATVAALHSLLVVPADELCLIRSFCWHRGSESPFLQPDLDSIANKSGFPEESAVKEEELTDAELVKLDVVKGLIRMDLLPRLRYILEVGSPDAAVTVQILEILIRIARHSMDLAYEIFRCPRLLKVIVAKYLPASWNIEGQTAVSKKQVTSAEGVPLCQALKLIRVLASADRLIAAKLINLTDITTSMLCYASIDPVESGLLANVALDLCIESYNTWRVFLQYGLAGAQYIEFYPLIRLQVKRYEELCMNMEVTTRAYDYEHAASLLSMLAAAVRAVDRDGHTPSPGKLRWSHVSELGAAVRTCLGKWIWELTKADEVTHSTLTLIGVTLGFLIDFFEKFVNNTKLDLLETTNWRDHSLAAPVIPFLESDAFRSQLASLANHSSFLNPIAHANRRYPANLPAIGAILWDGASIPCFEKGTPFSLLSPLIRYSYTLCRLVHGMKDMMRGLFVDHPLVISYLHRLVKVTDVTIGSQNAQLYHKVAIFLLPNLHHGDETEAMTLLLIGIFNPSFIPELNDLTGAMEGLGLKEQITLVRPTLQQAGTSKLGLLHHTGQSLKSICQTYQSALAHNFAKFGSHHKWKSPDSLSVKHHAMPPISGVNFPYLPITQLYRKVTLSTATPSAEDALALLHSLQWCHLLECWRSNTDPHIRFCNLCLVFLVSPDLFLDTQIGCYLEGCLRQMAERGELSSDLLESATINDVASFQDLYYKLLEQFEAVSYGDSLFANVIMVPLQRKYSVQLRRSVFTENITVVRALQLKLSELMLPFSAFSQPTETDLDLLACYFSTIVNGTVHPVRNQFLYVLIIHHLHHSLFACSSADDSTIRLRDSIVEQLRQNKNTELLGHLQNYVEPDAASTLGFSLQSKLSE